MAQNIVSVNQRPLGTGRNNGRNRRQPPPAPETRWFGPERDYLSARDSEIRKAQAMARTALALVNSEKQFYDVAGSVNPVVSPTAQCLTAVPEGDDDGNRQGRSIRVKELQVRLNFYSATAATSSQVVRVFIVKDNLPNGSVPSVGTLFEGGTQGILNMPVLDAQQGRFKWVYDETFTLGTLAGGQDAKVLVIRQKMDHVVSFIGSGGTTASSGQGTLWLFVLTDTITGNASTGAFYSRIRYYDN